MSCLQHKKLVEGTLYEEVSSASYSENDISNSLKNGILYLEDPIDHVRVSESDYSSNINSQRVVLLKRVFL